MNFDPVDVFGGALGSLFKRFLYFLTAVWIGSATGIAAMIVSYFMTGGLPRPWMLWAMLLAPVGLLNSWFLLNFAILVIGLAYSVKAEESGYRGWMILAGFCSLGVKLGDDQSFTRQWLPLAGGWLAWVMFVVMLGVSAWLLRQYFLTRWHHHLHGVQAETTMRELGHADLVRDRLAATRPPEAPAGVIVDLKR